MSSKEAIEKYLDFIRKDITFCTRSRIYERVKVIFASKEMASKHSIEPLDTDEWLLLPTCFRKRVSGVRIGKASPEVKEVWLALAVLTGMKDEAKVVEATRTHLLNKWG